MPTSSGSAALTDLRLSIRHQGYQRRRSGCNFGGGGAELEHRRSQGCSTLEREIHFGALFRGSCKCIPRAKTDILGVVLGGILHSEYDDD